MGQIQTIQDMAKIVAEKVDSVAEFLKSEIRICDERLDGNPSEYYDGVGVGFHNSEMLTLKHKRFCKKLLEMMNFEQ